MESPKRTAQPEGKEDRVDGRGESQVDHSEEPFGQDCEAAPLEIEQEAGVQVDLRESAVDHPPREDRVEDGGCDECGNDD